MEYVGGKSLKEIANDRRAADGRRPIRCRGAGHRVRHRGTGGARPSAQPQLLYCDFKVDNAMATSEDQLKLIDMGAVAAWTTTSRRSTARVGYQAPEVAEVGPSIASDLYTVARTLAVLVLNFVYHSGPYRHALLPPGRMSVFVRCESFYRLLVRATAAAPTTASPRRGDGEQLLGVLREIVAREEGQPRPAPARCSAPSSRPPSTAGRRTGRASPTSACSRRSRSTLPTRPPPTWSTCRPRPGPAGRPHPVRPGPAAASRHHRGPAPPGPGPPRGRQPYGVDADWPPWPRPTRGSGACGGSRDWPPSNGATALAPGPGSTACGPSSRASSPPSWRPRWPLSGPAGSSGPRTSTTSSPLSTPR